MDDCIFCQIVNHKIPCYQIHEDENYLAFLTIQPFTPGHTLIIPKRHFRWVNDVPGMGEYWKFARDVSQKIQLKLHPLFISYLTLGNEIHHAHIHLIPRYDRDNLMGLFESVASKNVSPDELSKIAAKINL